MATAAAAVVAKAQRAVISHFLSQNAVSLEAAVPFKPGKRIERKLFDRLRAEGVILPGKEGSFYIDVRELDQWQRSRRRRIGVALAAGAAAIGAGLALGLLG